MPGTREGLRVGIDISATLTIVALTETDRVAMVKVASTLNDYDRAVLDSVGSGRIEVPVQGLPCFDMGTACLLRSGQVFVAVSEQRGIGSNHPAVYEHFGIDVGRAKMVELKTASNWQFYGRWISQVIRVDTPGGTQSGLQELDWKQLPRPIYPLNPLPSWASPPGGG